MSARHHLRPVILCIDDQQIGLELRKRVLEKAGYEALIASSAHKALEIFRANHIDLVLTEHVRPEIVGGPALAATMKMLKPEVPVAIFSADLSEWTEDRRFANLFITKLVSIDELLRAIEKLLVKSHATGGRVTRLASTCGLPPKSVTAPKRRSHIEYFAGRQHESRHCE